MNRTELIMLQSIEEGGEFGQSVSKAMRFGPFEQRDLPTNNAERMQLEFNDFLAMKDMLNEEIPGLDLHRDEALIVKKRAKVEKYIKYSQELGICE